MDDAEFFLPSEIARLVYGHLKTMGCDEISARFLDVSPHLSECRELHKRNCTFRTEANGLSLKEILDQFLNMNKLILKAVNNMVSDSQRFKNPVEALNFILNSENASNEEQPILVMNTIDEIARDDPLAHSSSSEEVLSDFSLNLKTPDKSRSRRKVTKNRLDSIHEEDRSSDKSESQTSPHLNTSILKVPLVVLPRQSTRLQIKRASNDVRRSNSDGIKEIRKYPNDCETPRKVGKPPYSETKLQKPKTPFTLSSDSEVEITDITFKTNSTVSDDLNLTKDSYPSKPVNGLFSPEPSEITPKKKTLKVLKPRRPPPSSSEPQKRKNEKINCKRDRGTTETASNDINKENKKSKQSSVSPNQQNVQTAAKENEKLEITPRTSEELIFTADLSQSSEKSTKVRRRSAHAIQNEIEKTPSKSNKFNKSMSVMDDEAPVDISVIKEKLIDHTKLHEHLAANINKVIINSPQKKISLACTEELDNAIQKVINETASLPLFDEIINDLMGAFDNEERNLGEDRNSNLASQPENIRNDKTNEINFANDQNQMQMTKINADDPNVVIDEDVGSHTSEPNAIIIELQQDPLSNQDYILEQPKNFQKSLSSTEDIRNYVSCTADIGSSPDRNHGDTETQDSNVINLYSAENGEFLQPCEIASENERIYLNSNSVLFPVNDGLPVVINKPTEFRICGSPSPLVNIARKQKYVPIAPKPNCSSAETIQRNLATRKKRTRGGKRPI